MKAKQASGNLPLDNWPERYKRAYAKVFDELPEWKKADSRGNDRHSNELAKAVIKVAENDENFLDN